MQTNALLDHLASANPIFFWDPSKLEVERLCFHVDFKAGTLNVSSGVRNDILNNVFDGPGFSIIRVPNADQLTDSELEEVSHVLAGAFGALMPQNEAGDTFYRVQAKVSADRPEYRLSNTSGDTSMHTDCSYGDERPSAISLFCINPAVEGGESMIASGYRVLSEYAKSHHDNMSPLSRSYFYHRSHKRHADDEQVAEYRLLDVVNGTLSFRYKWPYIELGHKVKGVFLGENETHFFSSFETLANRADLVFRYPLKRGECLIGNNKWIFHNRAPYSDSPHAPKRLMIRHWIDSRTS